MLKTVALASVAVVSAGKIENMNYQTDFMSFMKKYGKKYPYEEISDRFKAFRANMDMIQSHNAEEAGYTMALNEFADMTWDEFRGTYKGYNHRDNQYLRSQNKHVHSGQKAANSIDWREKGAVTPIKNQGQCGSCWSFSTTGAVEGAVQIATGKLVSLSEQELVDCAGSTGNQGCNGGLMDNAFEWIIKHGGIDSESDYPYTAQAHHSCEKKAKNIETITGFKDVEQGSEEDLMDAVNKGPVSIAIEADKPGFQFYSGGVFGGECGKQLDHGVLLVGYGSDDGKDYWIVKNSWGESWGENGYIKLKRGMNQCGLANSASYPIASDATKVTQTEIV